MLAPPEGLRAQGVPGVNPGGQPRGQGVIPRRFKRKKNFVTDGHRTPDAWTDRRDSRNSYVDAYTRVPNISTGKFTNFWNFFQGAQPYLGGYVYQI